MTDILGRWLSPVLCLAGLVALVGCQQTDVKPVGASQSNDQRAASNPLPLAVEVLPKTDGLSGSKAWPLSLQGELHTLLASEKRGLLLVDTQGQTVVHQPGHFEGLALSARDGKHWLATIGQDDNQVAIFTLQQAPLSLRQVGAIAGGNSLLDGLCFYQSPYDQQLYLFVIDKSGQADQWLLSETDNVVKALNVRRLPVPVDGARCAAADATGDLYVTEEEVGIWRYRAEPETDAQREIVDLQAPWGGIRGTIEDLVGLPDGGLLALDAEQGSLLWYSAGEAAGAYRQYSLPAEDYQFEGLGYRYNDGVMQLVLFDDETDRYLAAKLAATFTAPVVPRKIGLQASAQTAPVDQFGDAADDPAIWVNKNTPQQSRVLGTDKRRGLWIYDLNGEKTQFFGVGRLNNVDGRYGFSLAGKTIDIAAASNRTHNSITLFGIDPQTGVASVLGNVATTMTDIYGLCMYQSKEGKTYVFANDKSGLYQQYRLQAASGSASTEPVEGLMVREFSLPSQPEGCVADDRSGRLYMGEEDAGIWLGSADPELSQQPPLTLIAKVGEQLVADVEGVALYQRGDKNYLIASSQGDDAYVIFNAEAPYEVKGKFHVVPNLKLAIDGVSETDGLDVVSANLGPLYPNGLLVLQDGRNVLPETPQNFKLVPWHVIEKQFDL